MNGRYVYVLPNDIMYKRVGDQSASEMLMNNGFISLQFSGNIAVIKTRPGYASSMAYDIDNRESAFFDNGEGHAASYGSDCDKGEV